MRKGSEQVVERSAVRQPLSFRQFGIHRLADTLLLNLDLIRQLTRREIQARYRGSALGLIWSFALPVLMLAIYTFVFSVVFRAKWDVDVGSEYEFALILFAGLLVFQFFAECVGRAPGLLQENASLITRVVFPLEALGWVVVLGATFNALIGFGILLVAHVAVWGMPPMTVFLLPFVLLPLFLMTAGFVWFLASLGLFVRDVRQVVVVIIPVLMFTSPVFYPVSALPEGFRVVMSVNPLAVIIEQVRQVLIFGVLPNFAIWAMWLLISIVVAWAGLAWFLITKRGFADAI